MSYEEQAAVHLKHINEMVAKIGYPQDYKAIVAAGVSALYAPLESPIIVTDILAEEVQPSPGELWRWRFQVHSMQQRVCGFPLGTDQVSEHLVITNSMCGMPQVQTYGADFMISKVMNFTQIMDLLDETIGQGGHPSMIRAMYKPLRGVAPSHEDERAGVMMATHQISMQATMIGGMRLHGEKKICLPLTYFPFGLEGFGEPRKTEFMTGIQNYIVNSHETDAYARTKSGRTMVFQPVFGEQQFATEEVDADNNATQLEVLENKVSELQRGLRGCVVHDDIRSLYEKIGAQEQEICQLQIENKNMVSEVNELNERIQVMRLTYAQMLGTFQQGALTPQNETETTEDTDVDGREQNTTERLD